MKANPKDYDIFNDVPPPEIKDYLVHKTETEARVMLQYAYNQGPHAIYNTTCNKAQSIISDPHTGCGTNNQWTTMDPLNIHIPGTVQSSYHTFSPLQSYVYGSNYIAVHKGEISRAKEDLKKAQEVKAGKFSYLWKENSVQTQIDTEEQSVQALLFEVHEQHIQTEQVIADVSTQTKNIAVEVSTQTDPYVDPTSKNTVKERDIKLTKFVSEFYNQFSGNEEIEAFYNQFFNIMDESQLIGEQDSNVD